MNEKLKSFKIIHLAICAGTIFAYIFSGQITMDYLKLPSIDASSAVYLAIPVLSIILSTAMFKTLLKSVDKSNRFNCSLGNFRRWRIRNTIFKTRLCAIWIIVNIISILFNAN